MENNKPKLMENQINKDTLVQLLEDYKKESREITNDPRTSDDMKLYEMGRIIFCKVLLKDLDRLCPTCEGPKVKRIIFKKS